MAYDVRTKLTADSTWGAPIDAGSATNFAHTGLAAASSHDYQVRERIGPDVSAWSGSVTAVTSPSAPGAPTGVTASAGNEYVIVSFNPPADDGGSAILEYRVLTNPGGAATIGESSPIAVIELTNGTLYNFTVAASNIEGYGPESTPSNSVTPGEPVTITDSFNRADSADLGANWTMTGTNSFSITGNQVAPTTAFTQIARHVTTFTQDVIFSEFVYAATPSGVSVFVGPAVQMPPLATTVNATDAFFFMTVSGVSASSYSIRRKNEDGTVTVIGASITGPAATPGSVLRLESTVNDLVGYHNGLEVIRRLKSDVAPIAHTHKGVGWYSTGNASIRIDSFRAEERGGIAPPPGATTLANPATSITSTGFVSSWSAATNANSYLVQRKLTPHTFWLTIATVTGLTFAHSGLSAETSYDVRIIPRNGEVPGSPSNVVTTITPLGVTPGATVLSPSTSITDTGYSSSWSLAANANNYLVQRKLAASGSFATVANPTTRTYAHTGLTAATAYDTRIIPRDGSIEGPTSNVVTTTTATSGGGAFDGFIMGMTQDEILALPTSGPAWSNITTIAARSWGPIILGVQERLQQTEVLAGAYLYARTGDTAMRTKVRNAVLAAPGTEYDGDQRLLGRARNTAAMVTAADLIGLDPNTPCTDTTRAPFTFGEWCDIIRTRETPTGGNNRWRSFTQASGDAAHNWCAFAITSRTACSLYLGDVADIGVGVTDKAANVVSNITRRWSGDRTYWQQFIKNAEWDVTMVCLPPGETDVNTGWNAINGGDCGPGKDGIMVEDASRTAASYDTATWADAAADPGLYYQWGSLQAWCQTLIMLRPYFPDVFTWGNSAFRRTLDWIHSKPGGRKNLWLGSRSQIQAWNYFCGSNFPEDTLVAGTGPGNAEGIGGDSCRGRCVGYTDWLYGG